MLHALPPAVIGVAAGLKDVVKADEVGLDIYVRMVDRIAHARLRGEVHHDVRLVLGKERVQNRLFRHVAAHEAEAAARPGPLRSQRLKPREAILLEGDLIVVVHAVDADHVDGIVLAQKGLRQKAADKARRAGDQNGFARKLIHGLLLKIQDSGKARRAGRDIHSAPPRG